MADFPITIQPARVDDQLPVIGAGTSAADEAESLIVEGGGNSVVEGGVIHAVERESVERSL